MTFHLYVVLDLTQAGVRMLESQEIWTDILEDKDKLSLKELAAKYVVGVGALAEAFKRTGTSRVPSAPAAAEAPKKPAKRGKKGGRPGSKDAVLEAYVDQLGKRPDSAIAKDAGVSARTVASFRTRKGIDAYSGKRTRGKRSSKVEPFDHLLGNIPDREIADRAKVSLNTVRNRRVSLGIKALGRSGAAKLLREQQDETVEAPKVAAKAPKAPKAPRASAAKSGGTDAWSITIQVGDATMVRVVAGSDLPGVAAQASAAAVAAGGSVVRMECIGPFFSA